MQLSLPSADAPRPPHAHPVPWRVDRHDRVHPVVWNACADPLDFVRVFREDASRRPIVDLRGRMLPADHMELCLCGTDVDEVVVTLAWFRPDDGHEYLWGFVV